MLRGHLQKFCTISQQANRLSATQDSDILRSTINKASDISDTNRIILEQERAQQLSSSLVPLDIASESFTVQQASENATYTALSPQANQSVAQGIT